MVHQAQVPRQSVRDDGDGFRLQHPLDGQDWKPGAGFGMQRHPLLGVERLHTGLDFSAAIGTRVVASAGGVVEIRGYEGSHGNRVIVRHSNDVRTSYSHLWRFHPGLEVGATVAAGEGIGFVGMTGLTVEPHLHFEVLVGDRPVDPLSLSSWPRSLKPIAP